ncbi:S-4TM family putative pore-forming effector [Caenimonas soli]|uniref:S-4TM family putative pore-forming effector n=1 Tax=Caenimonas soli TaxID=2735555 RepID=UPI001556A5D2|nr:S-4TM family putative pore-forming effector [Caenimonas soli]NPC58537.1 hypothetical protein [Caenimonas soli]
MEATNNIPVNQATPDLVKLARARQNTYKTAKWALGAFVLASIALPVLGAFFGKWDEAKPYFALAGLALLFIDVVLLQRKQKDSIKRAAKMAEEFDTKVLRLPWNRFVAGEKVLPEDVREASKKLLSSKREEQIASWYESAVGEVPLHFGRLVCQRTNINYDQRLRRQYGGWLLSLTAIVGGVLFLIAFAKDSKLSELVMGFAVPFTPVLAWALRENRKQLDTATSLDRLQSEFQKIWADAISGVSAKEMESRSRQLQDAIYQHRASAPLLFDWVYTLLRDKNEDEAHHAARALVNEAKAALAAKEPA